jgi:hypothetical protein
MSPSLKYESLGDGLRPWRDRRLGTLLASIQRLRRSRTLGPAVTDHAKARVTRRHFSNAWGWFDTIGLLILVTFAVLLIRLLLR